MSEDDVCAGCGMSDGWHLSRCRIGGGIRVSVPPARGSRAKRAPLSRGDRLIVAGIACAALAMLGALAFVLSGCHVGELAAPCDSMTLDRVRAECHEAVRHACARNAADVVDESCPTLIECTRRIESWRACADGGAS